MKKIFVLLLATSAKFLFAQEEDNSIRVKTTLKEVTVFLNHASLKHVVSAFNIPQGTQNIVLENVSASIIPPTIQISGKGNFVILSSEFRINYIQPKSVSKQIKQLEDSLEELQNKVNIRDIQLSTYDNEEQLLLENKKMSGNNTGISVAELEKMANFFRTRLNEIRAKKLELQPTSKKYQEQISKIKNQLKELNYRKSTPVGEIYVTVYANVNVNNVELSIEYICNNAHWSPQYEIRVNDLDKPANVLLKAEITQNTGVDWKNVNLSLSTSNPALNNNKPKLSPWWLYFQPNQYQKRKGYPKAESAPAAYNKNAQEIDGNEAEDTKTAEYAYEYTNASEKINSIEYIVSIPVTIESNNKSARIDIQNYNVSANYLYYAAPKITEYAYLIAQIPDWSKYNLLSATAYIFIENSFIGTSEINPDITKDTIEISLGIDKNISVKREIIKKHNEKKIKDNTRKETRAYEISIKNKKKNNINIIIEDQMPLSSVQEIGTELLEAKDASYDKITGKLQWRVNILPSEEKKVSFKYSVKYPKDKIIANF